MKRVVIDTNIILHYVSGSRLYQQIELENELSSSDTVILVSVVSIAELEGFLQRNNYSEAKLKKFESILAKTLIIDISNDAQELIEAFATLQNYSKNLHPTAKLGKSVGIRQNDLWIAATAWVTKAALITTDSDFDHLRSVFLNVIKCSLTVLAIGWAMVRRIAYPTWLTKYRIGFAQVLIANFNAKSSPLRQFQRSVPM